MSLDNVINHNNNGKYEVNLHNSDLNIDLINYNYRHCFLSVVLPLLNTNLELYLIIQVEDVFPNPSYWKEASFVHL